MIQNKTHCKKYYHNLPILQATIDKYMICTLAEGNIDDKGDQIVTHKPDADGCSTADKKAGRVSTSFTFHSQHMAFDKVVKQLKFIKFSKQREQNQKTPK